MPTPAATERPDVGDQAGRTWLITGATSGVGREVARAAARAGARVIAPARDADRGQRLLNELHQARADAVGGSLDLADLSSVRAFCATLEEPIDVLVNNAGVITPRRRESAEGSELMLGTNFLGPFALTNLLASRVRGRIVVVASNAHRSGHVDAADPHFRYRRWTTAAAYAQSKLCDMLWARALQRRLGSGGPDVDVQLAHPGWAFTNIQNVTGVRVLDRAVSAVCSVFAQPAATGALPVLTAATADLPVLSFIGPDGFRQLRGRPERQRPSDLALDNDAAEAVWQLGVRETGTDVP
ncbi:SDR family NAD(P)-dependent oxidoreductase [Ruania halotolerans]|uniref:SDR family NAD(P)-dependent oxidoreductase n=1 Tax=Ruania halotolerans TaxID=2897773 RepID=UPI001E4F085A|nr:SDR family NAD(P)-dependent oxidoreductase [Ruania halotolerans]UFU07473.1 SDR family NAD(P)-dependent oxidoreductase [Ruania halotolerans]